MNEDNTYSPNRWQERHRCLIHGPLSTTQCVICAAELALRMRLAKQRKSLKSKRERRDASTVNDEVQR